MVLDLNVITVMIAYSSSYLIVADKEVFAVNAVIHADGRDVTYFKLVH